MNLSNEQINQVYENLMFQLKLRIIDHSGTVQKFSNETGINRTSLVKLFSENIKQDMSVGMYYRILLALKIISLTDINPAVMDSKVTIKEYLLINNNSVMHSITIITNNL